MIKAKLGIWGGAGRGGGAGGLLVLQANVYCISNLGVTNTLYLGAIHRAVIKNDNNFKCLPASPSTFRDCQLNFLK